MKVSTVTSISALTLATATASAAVLGNLRLRRRLAANRLELNVERGSARQDRLTGLANRRRIDEELAARTGAGADLGILLIDLDDFKPVNDTFGHIAGDLVLVEVARRLTKVVAGAGDLVGRLGGDEFVILADCPYGPFSAMLARDTVAVIREPISIGDGRAVSVSASVGWVQVLAGDDPREALDAADVAMYRAKAAGGNQQVEYGLSAPLPEVATRPLVRIRDSHPHRIPSESGVVIAR
jgi:diguanylate cyclase (GGDEF)-like protein